MDSLTQIVLGASVGEAVLGKKIGNKAIWYGAIAGTIPDLDVIARNFTDTVTALELHRGFTHSILFAVIFGLFFGKLWSLWEKRATWKEWSWFWFLCFVTHPLLDAHTTWGTQLFWPFDLRLAYKNIFVIDPLYTLPFLVLLIMAMRLKRDNPKRRKWNRLGLLISSGYLVLTLVLKGITYHKFTSALDEQGIVYNEIETKPTPFNAILWTANVDTDDAYLIAYYSLFDEQPIHFASHPKNHQALGPLAYADKVKRLIKISQGWYVISQKEGRIYFNDLRFGQLSADPENQDYVFSFLLEPSGDDIVVSENEKRPEDAGRMLGGLWERIWGN